MFNNYPKRALICLGILVVLGLGGSSFAEEKCLVKATAEVEAREIAFAKTMADRDFDAFLSFISPEAIFFKGNEPLRGRDAIGEAWKPFYEGGAAPFSWHPDVTEVLDSGSLALSSGPVRNASGEEVGRFNSIWRKDEDGQWRVVFDKGS
jgi:ketosteroid isomerase-like protein